MTASSRGPLKSRQITSREILRLLVNNEAKGTQSVLQNLERQSKNFLISKQIRLNEFAPTERDLSLSHISYTSDLMFHVCTFSECQLVCLHASRKEIPQSSFIPVRGHCSCPCVLSLSLCLVLVPGSCPVYVPVFVLVPGLSRFCGIYSSHGYNRSTLNSSVKSVT